MGIQKFNINNELTITIDISQELINRVIFKLFYYNIFINFIN